MNAIYPQGRKFFAHRYCRLLAKTCAAQEIGHIAALLCTYIVHLEDSTHYTKPISFYNDQLLPLLAINKWKSLDRARSKAVAAGWLEYVPGRSGSHEAGLYWTVIPDRFINLPDTDCSATGDDDTQQPPKDRIRQTDNANGLPYPRKGYAGGVAGGVAGGELPSLSLTLNTKSRKRPVFVQPSEEEVQAYWTQKKLQGDPDEYRDHYQANGWTQGKGKPLTDWKAAANNWSRRQSQFSRNDSASPDSQTQPDDYA
ncbi:MAG: hypothetical protein WCJ35_12765 [Planctomycetota bacterium]